MDPAERLLAGLQSAYRKSRAQTRKMWQRDLPFSEMIFDRWERAQQLGFGDGTSIYHLSYVYGEVHVGENTWIGPYTVLDGSGGLFIGSSCSVSSGVHIYSHDTVEWALSGGVAPYRRAPVVIGDCCYIGAKAVIGKGVKIGEHSVVGACAFVNKDIPAFSVAVGVPARVVGKVVVSSDGDVSFAYDSARTDLS